MTPDGLSTPRTGHAPRVGHPRTSNAGVLFRHPAVRPVGRFDRRARCVPDMRPRSGSPASGTWSKAS